MRDRLSLFPLETPIRLSSIILDVRDQEARDVITEFDLQMSRAWLGSESFQHLPQGLSIPIGNAAGKLVTIHDDRGRFVEAYEQGRRVSLDTDSRRKYSQSHQQMVDRINLSPALDAVDPTVVAIGVKDRLVRVASPVLDAQKEVAYWISGWPSLDELSSIDAAAVGITAKFTTFSLAHGGKFSHLRNIDLSDYMDAFSRGKITPPQMGDLRDGVGLDLRSPYLVYSTRDTTDRRDLAQLNGLFRGSLEDVTLFVSNVRQNATSKEIAESLSKTTLGNSNAGISEVRAGLEGSQRSAYEALVALEVATELQKNSETFFGDLGFLRNVAYWDPKLMDHLIKTQLGVILDYEDKEKLDLIPSLIVFCESGRNVLEASRRLSLHRNTMYYRLNRAAALLQGIDVSWVDLNNKKGALNLDIRNLVGVEAAAQVYRMQEPLAVARRLCSIDNPQNLL